MSKSLFPLSPLNPLNRLIREPERKLLTGISRSHAFQLERRGEFPARVQISANAVGWRLSEIQAWIEERQSKEGS